MGIYQSKYRMELEILLKRIRDLKIESDYLTPIELLRLTALKTDAVIILGELDLGSRYLPENKK